MKTLKVWYGTDRDDRSGSTIGRLVADGKQLAYTIVADYSSRASYSLILVCLSSS